MSKKSTEPQKVTSSTPPPKGITIVRLNEIINLCKEKGVSKIKITGKDVELELFPWAVSVGSVQEYSPPSVDRDDNLGHNDDKTDMDLLFHSAGSN